MGRLPIAVEGIPRLKGQVWRSMRRAHSVRTTERRHVIEELDCGAGQAQMVHWMYAAVRSVEDSEEPDFG